MHGPHHIAGAMLGRHIGSQGEDFIPGLYLSGRPVGSSNCNYSFWSQDNDDPWTMLNYSNDQVQPSLELGKSSPFKVVYNILNSSNNSKDNIITYCTHATPELLYHISELLRHWDGSVSITVYAPGEDAHLAVKLIDRLCKCIPDMHRVSLHITFPSDLPPKRDTANIILPNDCSPPDKPFQTVRHAKGMTYPVNVARNSAREAAKTQFVLVSDIELQPNAGLAAQFADLMRRLRERRLSLQRQHPDSQTWTGDGFVYVVPVFEIDAASQVPSTKEQLLKLYTKEKAVFFHRWVCPHCQKFPGLQKWIRKKGKDGILQVKLV
jgi:N-acetyllactosaminide beta-1,3-N-acetylglucosaminyltransferase